MWQRGQSSESAVVNQKSACVLDVYVWRAFADKSIRGSTMRNIYGILPLFFIALSNLGGYLFSDNKRNKAALTNLLLRGRKNQKRPVRVSVKVYFKIYFFFPSWTLKAINAEVPLITHFRELLTMKNSFDEMTCCWLVEVAQQKAKKKPLASLLNDYQI